MIHRNLICTAVITLFTSMIFAQTNKKQQDIDAIKAMCGCYEITFKYTETFAPEIDYEKGFDYTATALEWAEIVEEKDNKIAIQHLLVLGDTTVIKHWRQDWEFENTKVFSYNKDNQWNFKELSKEAVKGQWTQKVFQVDDSPRYSGSATWIHADGKHYWENVADSPLPRREYTKRKDYNVMLRGNRQEITKDGWIHEQDNDKVVREDGKEDVLLAQEKGYNIYTKVDDEKCKVAQDWWKNNSAYWAKVRTKWDDVYSKAKVLTLKPVVDQKPLFMHLAPVDEKTDNAAIQATIDSFITK